MSGHRVDTQRCCIGGVEREARATRESITVPATVLAGAHHGAAVVTIAVVVVVVGNIGRVPAAVSSIATAGVVLPAGFGLVVVDVGNATEVRGTLDDVGLGEDARGPQGVDQAGQGGAGVVIASIELKHEVGECL